MGGVQRIENDYFRCGGLSRGQKVVEALRCAEEMAGGASIDEQVRICRVTQGLAHLGQARGELLSGKLELVVEPRLDAKSSTAWYVFADPGMNPVVEYSYLAGSEGPQVDSKAGWEVLGMDFRCVLDFGAGVIDSKGAYKGNS